MDYFTISDQGLILQREKIVLAAALQHNAFQKGHLGGHPRIDSLKIQIRRHFWFLKMNEFIEFAVRSCHLCQIFTIKTTKEPITPTEPLSKPGMKSVSISLA